MRMHGAPVNLIATSLIVDASLAPLTVLIAVRRGRSGALWAAIGFIFGAWALLAALLLFSLRRQADSASYFPPPSDAA
ncbi:MAG: hypothetical protein IVW54_11790 [Candidatus Binataceae bacterium]|nr:hypothetical protein [Candidatus Binataceae bacterium]